MKVKVISRNPDEYLRETKDSIHVLPRNIDPALHPFEGPREYVRALNATKLERVFAKPFVANLDGHKDGISCLTKHPTKLATIISGAYDGEVKLWSLTSQSCIQTIQAHDGHVRDVCFLPDGSRFLSVGIDSTIKTWSASCLESCDADAPSSIVPLSTIISKSVISSISHQRKSNIFATCGDQCQLWEHERNEPIRAFSWNVDSLHHVAFNPIDKHILASCASDRSIILYDTRATGPIRKVVMSLRSNQVSWNPMEAFVFTAANEDFNLYSYDVRKLSSPLFVHKDMTSAVTSVDYSPTGKEFVAGGYDKSLRLYNAHQGHSRDIYHTKRMQHVTHTVWSLDNKYVISASDEMNLRVWKAHASENLGYMNTKQRQAVHYTEALKAKYASHPQVRRIARHRQVPRHIYNAANEHRSMRNKVTRKEANKRKHSKPGTVPHVAERTKAGSRMIGQSLNCLSYHVSNTGQLWRSFSYSPNALRKEKVKCKLYESEGERDTKHHFTQRVE
uniref:DDB1- and CUL4-associated factor 13 n=1 Tax=Cacopsylla melanoneura TaxID=428564 RepID=A0A8D8UIM1_9HEMI